MNRRVAIIIPTYNEERYIADCLQSVFCQNYDPAELDIMVVDGGSRDATCRIVREIAERRPNVRLIENPRKIQSSAFNIGVASSDAPFIVRLDAHAVYAPDYVSLCVKHLTEHERYGNVGGRWDIRARRSTLIADANAVLNRMRFGIGGADFRVGGRAGEVDTVPFGAFRRETVEKVGGMNESLPRGEDNEYNARIHAAGYKIYFDPQIVSTYYARPTVGSSLRQMYANGVSIGILWMKYRAAVGMRHLVPLLFVCSLVLGGILALFFLFFRYLLLAEIVVYAAADLFSCAAASRRAGWRNMLVLPWLIPMIHFAYGIGTFVGIVKSYNR